MGASDSKDNKEERDLTLLRSSEEQIHYANYTESRGGIQEGNLEWNGAQSLKGDEVDTCKKIN